MHSSSSLGCRTCQLKCSVPSSASAAATASLCSIGKNELLKRRIVLKSVHHYSPCERFKSQVWSSRCKRRPGELPSTRVYANPLASYWSAKWCRDGLAGTDSHPSLVWGRALYATRHAGSANTQQVDRTSWTKLSHAVPSWGSQKPTRPTPRFYHRTRVPAQQTQCAATAQPSALTHTASHPYSNCYPRANFCLWYDSCSGPCPLIFTPFVVFGIGCLGSVAPVVCSPSQS